MRLAIGDVVRDRTDMALGTVVDFAGQPGEHLVVVQVSRGVMRLTQARGLEIVARRRRPTRRLLICFAFGLALLAAFAVGHGAWELGAGWPLTALAGFGGFTAVALVHSASGRLLDALRRIRV